MQLLNKRLHHQKNILFIRNFVIMTFIKKHSVFILLFIIWVSFSSFNPLMDDWQLKKYENGIAVYIRDNENSAFKELKAVTYLNATLSSTVALLYDWDTYPQWVYKCGKSSTLKIISEKELIHYQTVLAPWPAENRDFIVNIKIDQDKTTKAVTIRSYAVSQYIPAIPDYVRITKFNASWVLTPQKNGTIEIVYQLFVDPGGAVPAWIVNLAVVDGPFETLNNMKTWVTKDKYKKTKIPFIVEPD